MPAQFVWQVTVQAQAELQPPSALIVAPPAACASMGELSARSVSRLRLIFFQCFLIWILLCRFGSGAPPGVQVLPSP